MIQRTVRGQNDILVALVILPMSSVLVLAFVSIVFMSLSLKISLKELNNFTFLHGSVCGEIFNPGSCRKLSQFNIGEVSQTEK